MRSDKPTKQKKVGLVRAVNPVDDMARCSFFMCMTTMMLYNYKFHGNVLQKYIQDAKTIREQASCTGIHTFNMACIFSNVLCV